jgi:multidrug efflux pump subunit AcrB
VVVDTAINEFTESLWQAILIILGASFVALGLRPGTVVACAIPLTLAIVFAIMLMYGIDLQRISLGALIIALTLLVDDAMTTVDAMLRRLAVGDTKEEAGTFAYRTLAAPMLAGTLITIAGFVPIGFAQSSAGEYTFSIFAVVGIALLVSWLVAVIFAPLIGVAILKTPKDGSDRPGAVERAFRGFLSGALRVKWLTILFTLAAFVAAAFLLRFVPQQFFPSSDRPELTVDLTLRQNASIFATDKVLERLEEKLAADPDIDSWSTYVGRGAIRFYLPLNAQLANPFFGQLIIVAKDLESRLRLEPKLEKLLAEEFPDVVARVSPLELGPPVGWPLQWRVVGPDKEEVTRIAKQLAQVMASDPDARHVHFDWLEPARQLRIKLDQEQVRRLNISSAQLAATVNAAISGSTITQVRDDIYLVNVVARAQEAEREALTTLRSLQVPIPGGRTVPLAQFATFEYEQEFPLVWRRNREPTITVRADVQPGVLPDNVLAKLEPKIDTLAKTLPPRYRIELGGIAEESEISSSSVFAVIPLMLLIMLTVLMFAVQSFRRLGLVITVLPLGIIGVVLALLASNRPLGFVAILGVLSLLGMIAKNGVILITQIEADRGEGLEVREALLRAASSRLRPMLLTAVSTVLGLIPIAPTVFWGPMAFAIMGGLLVATLLTLVFLPALYLAVFEREDRKAATPPAQPAAL